ncbi:hypothetical protein C8F01DRAFT_1107223 [Mycena amicta]|nr:hypothetical protein C8F01DRAFT_1107223 [Mycena amicta]
MPPLQLNDLAPELKLEIYSNIPHTSLLPLSHVSKFWRSIVLKDSRWDKWFEMIVNSDTGERIREVMARFKVLDIIPKRTIVTLCFTTKCSVCKKDTPSLFLPLLRRICYRCLNRDGRWEMHSVISLSSALEVYDLREEDVRDVVVLHWENKEKITTKLVNRFAIEDIAIARYGYKKLDTYERRLDAARSKEGYFAAEIYQEASILPTNFLVNAHSGCPTPQKLVRCKMCEIIADIRAEASSGCCASCSIRESKRAPPSLILSGLLDEHEQNVHYANEGRQCRDGCADYMGFLPPCKICSNAEALATKARLVATGHWND